MAKKAAHDIAVTEDLLLLRETVEQEARAMALTPLEKKGEQLFLFKEFADEQPPAARRVRTAQGLSWAEELMAQFMARGVSQTQAYLLSHPNCKTRHMATVYPKASRTANTDKFRARLLQIKACLASEGLMSTTEFGIRLTKWARRQDKAGYDALLQVGRVLGKFDEKNPVGSTARPLVIRWGGAGECDERPQGARTEADAAQNAAEDTGKANAAPPAQKAQEDAC